MVAPEVGAFRRGVLDQSSYEVLGGCSIGSLPSVCDLDLNHILTHIKKAHLRISELFNMVARSGVEPPTPSL